MGPPLKIKNKGLHNSIDESNRETVWGRRGQSVSVLELPIVPWERCRVVRPDDGAPGLGISMVTHHLTLPVCSLTSRSVIFHIHLSSPRKSWQRGKVFCGNQEWSWCRSSEQAHQSFHLQNESPLLLPSCGCRLCEFSEASFGEPQDVCRIPRAPIEKIRSTYRTLSWNLLVWYLSGTGRWEPGKLCDRGTTHVTHNGKYEHQKISYSKQCGFKIYSLETLLNAQAQCYL